MTSITVEGADAFQSSVRDAADELAHMEAAEAEAGRIVQSRASSLAPKLSGALSGSISADTSGDGVTVGTSLEYAAVQEYGGGNNISAQPYMRPAIAESTEQVVAAYGKGAEEALSKVHGA